MDGIDSQTSTIEVSNFKKDRYFRSVITLVQSRSKKCVDSASRVFQEFNLRKRQRTVICEGEQTRHAKNKS